MIPDSSEKTPPPLPTPPPPYVPPPPAETDEPGIRFLIPVKTSPWAIAAGYLGLFSMTLVLAPVSIVVSIIALRKVAASRSGPKPQYGKFRAIFGLVMGLLGTAALIAVLIASTR